LSFFPIRIDHFCLGIDYRQQQGSTLGRIRIIFVMSSLVEAEANGPSLKEQKKTETRVAES
jgi:hypothetical protein